MAIGSDYPHPIIVNGYACRNCDDVANAKKFIDPSKAADGVEQTALKPADAVAASDNDWRRAVTFGGTLSFRNDVAAVSSAAVPSQWYDKVA